jgi:hypothetical protein
MITYHPAPDEFRGKGTVFAAWDESRGTYSAYWDLLPDGPPTPLEECPPSASKSFVMAWGRERAPRVLIRPREDPGRYYWAGVAEPDGADRDLPRLAR